MAFGAAILAFAVTAVSWGQAGLVVSARSLAGTEFIETFRTGGDGNRRLVQTLEMPIRGAGEVPTRRFVYERTGDVTRPGVRSSILAATVVVALALVLAVERAIPGTSAR